MHANLALSCVFAFGCVGGDIDLEGVPPLPDTDGDELAEVSTVDVLQADGTAVAFFLSRLPRAETIEVRVKDSERGVVLFFTEAVGDPPVGDYAYDPSSNSVRFLGYVPPPQSDVIVSYTPQTTPSR
jgi:hypothetical protein